LSGLALNLDPPDPSLSRWDYRPEPPAPGVKEGFKCSCE
jgi:hypothetical protein